jgi:hypothetical protein
MVFALVIAIVMFFVCATVREHGKYCCNGIATGENTREGGHKQCAHDGLTQVIGMLL